VKRVSVSFGGADPLGMAKKYLDCVKKRDSLTTKCEFHFILGAMEPDLEEIRQEEEKLPWLFTHVAVKDMKGILEASDLVISAAGSTQYEICACQIPCINFSMADNQVPGGEEFGRRGIFRYVGDVRGNERFYEDLADAVETLAADYSLRVKMGELERKLVDGMGAGRIADRLLKGDLNA